MWTIKEAADRAGLSPDVLRAWERRYGVVRPTRTSSGYRLYSEADIGRLQAMQRLIDDGFRPREAAEVLARRPERAGSQRANGAGVLGELAAPVPGRRSSDGAASELNVRLVAAATAFDVGALRAYFDAIGAFGSFEAACEACLFPGFRAIGDAWADGRLSVAGEHAASAAAMRWLGAHYRAAARDGAPPQVLVALPPGARHELGAFAHAVALRRRGVSVLYLGADLPVEDVGVAVRVAGASVLVLGAVVAGDVPAAERVAVAIEAAVRDVRLAFGGEQAGTLAAHGTVLPGSLDASVEAVLELLRD